MNRTIKLDYEVPDLEGQKEIIDRTTRVIEEAGGKVYRTQIGPDSVGPRVGEGYSGTPVWA